MFFTLVSLENERSEKREFRIGIIILLEELKEEALSQSLSMSLKQHKTETLDGAIPEAITGVKLA
jgi:hypothetical protein